ncbi:MAG: glycoside hydrolase family 97 N-terminal domain-containing protein, partial [Flavobacteriaceae bacterium]|nr:glycoside hydrolase family 97 N-terminal domain-containing protein [Flavobacteriaceae bacterium]
MLYRLLITLLVVTSLTSCTRTKKNKSLSISSPSEINSVSFFLAEDGSAKYMVKHNEAMVIDTSSMSFDFKDQASIQRGLKVIGKTKNAFSETWEMPWGEQREVQNNYNELIINLQEENAPYRKMNIHFKAYDDGIGFRYEFLAQEGKDSLTITDENTEFKLTGDHTTFWIPGDWDIYEHLYSTTPFSKINAITKRNHPNLAQSYIPENAVNTPVTMRTSEGLHLSFHEANLTDYADMTLKIDTTQLGMTSELVGSDRFQHKVKRALPFKTPWRTIQISDKATELIDSKLILNLNEP